MASSQTATAASAGTAAAPKIEIERVWQKLNKPEVGVNGYTGFNPRTETLRKGHQTGKGWDGRVGKPLSSDITIDYDVEIVMRDGARLYADICRPADLKQGDKVPIILSWSPYGKAYAALDMLPVCTWKCGVVPSDLSGLEKFEGVDPADWCPAGYAVASVDQRGCGNSDGKVVIMGEEDAKDGYDTVEFLAKLPYCNGKVGMAGNSHLAIAQYHIAAQHPPSLAAIAPWEGLSDLYRDQFVRGGIFNISNFKLISSLIIRGNDSIEDFEGNYYKYPYADAPYWQDKRVQMKKVNIPTYIMGSDVSSLHTMGALRAWLEIDTPHKWLRWGGYQEWFDLYSEPHSVKDLMGFFDRFLKDKDNGWDKDTPRVRMTALQFGDKDPIEDIVVDDWPLPETKYTDFYLTGDNQLSLEAPRTCSSVIYDSEHPTQGLANFDFKFEKDARLMGLPKATLYMSCDAIEDICVFVSIRKLDKDGSLLKHVQVRMDRRWVKKYADIPAKDHSGVIIHPGSLGILRASRRAIDRSKSLHPNWPFHPHDKDEKVPVGQIVQLEVGIWHLGADWEAGQSLRLEVSGSNPGYPELKEMNGARPEDERNKGNHTIYISPEHPSRVNLPVIYM